MARSTRSDWMGRTDVALISLNAVAGALRLLAPTAGLTGVVCLAAVLLLPGAVIAHLLSLDDPVTWFATCVSASLAALVLGSMVMLWLGAWSPVGFAALLLSASATALAAHCLGYWGATTSGTSKGL